MRICKNYVHKIVGKIEKYEPIHHFLYKFLGMREIITFLNLKRQTIEVKTLYINNILNELWTKTQEVILTFFDNFIQKAFTTKPWLATFLLKTYLKIFMFWERPCAASLSWALHFVRSFRIFFRIFYRFKICVLIVIWIIFRDVVTHFIQKGLEFSRLWPRHIL